MYRHIVSNLILLVATIVICSVLYPGVLWCIGQVALREKANGSLITNKEGVVVGSRLIAQPFAGDEYFQPRPSAVGYNGAATGGSNLGPNNPALRKRVAGMLGTLLKYRDGKPVGPDIVTWVKANLEKDRTILNRWVAADGNLAERWGGANAEFLASWEKEHQGATADWHKKNPDTDANPAVLAGLFFGSYVNDAATAWPETDGKDVQIAFFELWWKEHSNAAIEAVPSDLVMTSGAGLDPHITLKAARYQLDRVAGKWAETTNQEPAQVKQEIEVLIKEKSSAPLGGLVGVEMVNVLELNLALKDRFGS
jgi:K+-transporting ATPase ATPase C chain